MITTLKSKWRAYVGPTDERIKAHENEVFARMGKFLMIANLCLAYYALHLEGLATRTNLMNDWPRVSLVLIPSMVLLVYTGLSGAWACSRFTKAGYVDKNRFAETETFPRAYFALLALLSAIAFFALLTLSCAAAEFQVVGWEKIAWADIASTAAFLSAFVGVMSYIAMYLEYLKARRSRRARLGEMEG